MGFSKDEIPDLTIYGPKGCPECNGTGYKGRVGIYELMEVTEEVAKSNKCRCSGRSIEKDSNKGRHG